MSHEKLFGTDLNTSRHNELKFNYCLLFAKYYLYYQKMYYKACNITEFVLKLEQKLFIESRLKRKLLVWKCFCPLTRLVSTFVLYFIFYGFVFDYTIFCIILVLPLRNPVFFFVCIFFPDILSCVIFPFQNVKNVLQSAVM